MARTATEQIDYYEKHLENVRAMVADYPDAEFVFGRVYQTREKLQEPDMLLTMGIEGPGDEEKPCGLGSYVDRKRVWVAKRYGEPAYAAFLRSRGGAPLEPETLVSLLDQDPDIRAKVVRILRGER